MMMLWLASGLRSASARSRATLSVGPPAANGTTMVIGFSGYSAEAAAQKNRPAAAARRSRFIWALEGRGDDSFFDPCRGRATEQTPSAPAPLGQAIEQNPGEVQGLSPRAVGDLVPAAGAVGDDQRVGRARTVGSRLSSAIAIDVS